MLTSWEARSTRSSFGLTSQRRSSGSYSWPPSSGKRPGGIFLFTVLTVGLMACALCIVSSGCAFKVTTGPSLVELDLLPCAPSVQVGSYGAVIVSPACPPIRPNLTFGLGSPDVEKGARK